MDDSGSVARGGAHALFHCSPVSSASIHTTEAPLGASARNKSSRQASSLSGANGGSGFAITSIACYQGFYTRTDGGANGVGKSTTAAVVVSCVTILCLNYILAILLL